ncbi:hypothetical protein [Methanothermobacter sp. EMTCatA1]|uniref:hypothetical protein n=1 Tax=Methanothermobacter TaxID=145260 RepID=UPI00257D809D|nr:hypothetical protein [Methanothermobacter sp. EMTCatA1]
METARPFPEGSLHPHTGSFKKPSGFELYKKLIYTTDLQSIYLMERVESQDRNLKGLLKNRPELRKKP